MNYITVYKLLVEWVYNQRPEDWKCVPPWCRHIFFMSLNAERGIGTKPVRWIMWSPEVLCVGSDNWPIAQLYIIVPGYLIDGVRNLYLGLIPNGWRKGLPTVVCIFSVTRWPVPDAYIYHVFVIINAWDIVSTYFFLNNGLDNTQWASSISDLYTKLRIINRRFSGFATGPPCGVWRWTISRVGNYATAWMDS